MLRWPLAQLNAFESFLFLYVSPKKLIDSPGWTLVSKDSGRVSHNSRQVVPSNITFRGSLVSHHRQTAVASCHSQAASPGPMFLFLGKFGRWVVTFSAAIFMHHS